MSEPWAVVEGVSKTYGHGPTLVRALTDVRLEVGRGELIMVQGPSGSGKTTLLQILGLLLRADGGRVWIGGRRMDDVPESRLARERRHHVGFVFQGFNLLESLTVRDNVAVGARLRTGNGDPGGGRIESATALADRSLERVNLSNRAGHLPRELSGGEKQRTGIARALACPGRLILADEPTANLDWNSACEVMECLVALARDEQRAVVVVSHDLRLEGFADRIVELADGRITGTRPPRASTMIRPHGDDKSDESDGQTQRHQPTEQLTGGGPAKPVDDAAVDPPHRRRRGPWLVLLAVGAVAAIWLVAQQINSSDAVMTPPQEPPVAPRPGEQFAAAAPAVVEPFTQLIALGSERPGRIKAILKNAGEPVKKGEPLVLLDDSTEVAMVELRRADLHVAQANLADLNAWYRAEERARSKARLDKAQAILDRTHREYERVTTLHADASASQTELDDAVEELRIAEAALEEADQDYRMAQAGPTVQEVMIAEARVAQARAALGLAQAELDLLTIRSPIDGHVIYRHQEPGEIVDIESQLPIVSVGDLHKVRLRAEVDESDINRVHVGQSIIATADALGEQILRGRVVHMEPIMGRKTIRTQRTTERKDTKVREVLIELEPGHPPLPIDLQMTVRFIE